MDRTENKYSSSTLLIATQLWKTYRTAPLQPYLTGSRCTDILRNRCSSGENSASGHEQFFLFSCKARPPATGRFVCVLQHQKSSWGWDTCSIFVHRTDMSRENFSLQVSLCSITTIRLEVRSALLSSLNSPLLSFTLPSSFSSPPLSFLNSHILVLKIIFKISFN